MKLMSDIVNVNEDLEKQYDNIIERLQEAKMQGRPIDEGILGAIGGATFGPAVMRAVCDALGINQKGALGNLMTSRLVLTAIGAKL